MGNGLRPAVINHIFSDYMLLQVAKRLWVVLETLLV